MQNAVLVLFIFLVLLTGKVFSAEDQKEDNTIVVREKKEPRTTPGSDIVTAAEIEKRQLRTVAEALQGLPGLQLSRAGGDGNPVSVFIRGARSGHTYVLLDGLPLNNPASVDNSADIDGLETGSIAKIEILRGPHTVLYGPNAAAGVIVITSRQGVGEKQFSLLGESGLLNPTADHFTPNILRARLGALGGTQQSFFMLNGSILTGEGMSLAKEEGFIAERDRMLQQGVSFAGGYTLSKTFSLNGSVHYSTSNTEIDNGPGPYADDNNHRAEGSRLFARFLFKGRFGQFLSAISFAAARHQLEDHNSPDNSEDTLGFFSAEFVGEQYSLDWRSKLKEGDSTLIFGTSYELGRAGSSVLVERSISSYHNALFMQTTHLLGMYGHIDAALFSFFRILAGARYSLFLSGGEDILQQALSLEFEPVFTVPQSKTELWARFASGFRPPSVLQLYSIYGSPKLKPEELLSVETGVRQPFFDRRLSAEAVLFYRDVTNQIDFNYGCAGSVCGSYSNMFRFFSYGLEFSLEGRPYKNLTLAATYTWTHPQNYRREYWEGAFYKKTLPVLRRAEHQGSLQVGYRFGRSVDTGFSVAVTGNRYDTEYRYPLPPKTVPMSAFVLASLYASWKIDPNIKLFGRIENLFNTRYELVHGYNTAGISPYGGVSIVF